jgi:hypothetical protein
MTIQERLLLSGCVAGLQIAEVAIESPKLRYYHVIPADWFVGLRVVHDPSPHWLFLGSAISAQKGARAVSCLGIGFLTPCLKETAGIKFDRSKTIKGREPCSGK